MVSLTSKQVGDPKEVIRTRIHGIFKTLGGLYPYSKVFSSLIEHGLKANNARTRAESAEELGMLLQRQGMGVCQPAKAMPAIAALIGDRDSSVRSAAITAISHAYVIIGDGVYKYIGELTDKNRTMLEEKLKRTASGPSSPALGGRPAAAPAQPQSPGRPESRLARPTGISRLAQPAKRRASVVGDGEADRVNTDRVTAGPSQQRSIPAPSSHRSIPAPSATSRLPSKPQPSHSTPREPVVESSPKMPSDPFPGDSGIENVVKEICSSDAYRSVDALKAVQEEIRAHPEGLLAQVDQLVDSITAQMDFAFGDLDVGTSHSTLRLCKHIMTTLSNLFDQRELAREVSRGALVDLLGELTHRLLDTADSSAGDTISNISRFLNTILIRIFHHSEQSSCFGCVRYVNIDAG
jgi:cytoskeleton-associated protein 5